MQALLGDKYGHRPFPSAIEATEYHVLYETASELCKDVSLLDEWFIVDENVVPPTYLLQPVNTKFTYYHDESEEHRHLHHKVEKGCLQRPHPHDKVYVMALFPITLVLLNNNPSYCLSIPATVLKFCLSIM